MPGMTVNEVEALARHVERQGVKTLRTKNGYLFRLPNQDTCNVHFTSSDVNQKHHIRRALKRAGISMPEERKINGRGSTKRTRKVVRDAIVAMGDPEVLAIKELKTHLSEPLGSMTITGALQTMGYAASGSTSARRFHRPVAVLGFEDETPTPPKQEEGARSLMLERMNGTEAEVQRERELTEAKPEREFVDTVGSWMVDPVDLPETLSIRDARVLLERVGLGMEIRVWRKDGGGK